MIALHPDNPPRLGRNRRENALSIPEIRAGTRGLGDVAAGLALLWHDHWDAAHEIAQSNEGDPDHDLLHALVHRREGDFGNSGYWFREAGEHPCFPEVAARVDALLPAGHPLRKKFLPDGRWSPRGFLDAVKRGRGGANEPLLRAVQAEEVIAFFEWLRVRR